MNALVPIEPSNLAEAVDFADRVSKADLLASALRGKPADVLVAILTGRELGLSPMQSLRGMHVIEGKPTMSADLMVALCVRQGDVCRYFRCTETNERVARYETERTNAGVTKLAFTIEQAKLAGLSGKDNWRKYPDAMLRSRCAAALARMVYPDLLAGVYAEGELAEPAPVGPRAVEQPAAVDVEFTRQDAPEGQPEPEATRPAIALEAQIREAATVDALALVRADLIDATTKGTVNPEEKAKLAEVYADRKKELTPAAQAAA